MKQILLVCMGNICRSPTAHGVMQHKVSERHLDDKILIDSAGTHAYHVGEKPDARSRAKAKHKGVDMEYIRARKISVLDYDGFDYILAMDEDNLELIHYYAPDNHTATIGLFLDYARRAGATTESVVPDPYYGGDDGFERVFQLVDVGCDALIEHLLND